MPKKRRGIENNLIEESSSQKSFLQFNVHNPYTVAIIVILALFAFFFLTKSWFIAATVNNTPISRFAVIRELEKQGGKQTLSGLITQTLILQEAKKQHVTVEQKEIDDEFKKAEAQLAANGQTLDGILAARGLTKEAAMEQIRMEKLIEKMIGNNITVNDKDIDNYMEKNKDSLPQSTDSAKLRQSIADQLKQQKMRDTLQSWLEDLQKKAKINYFVSY